MEPPQHGVATTAAAAPPPVDPLAFDPRAGEDEDAATTTTRPREEDEVVLALGDEYDETRWASNNATATASSSASASAAAYTAAPSIYYRRMRPSDWKETVRCHRALFPIEYEASFYSSSIREELGIITLAAMERRPRVGGGCDEEAIIGVVTARVRRTGETPEECDVLMDRLPPTARRVHFPPTTPYSPPPSDASDPTFPPPLIPPPMPYVYLLTLGVLDTHRRRGIASELLRRVCRRAAEERGCALAFLHVIAHNADAMRFYERMAFVRAMRHENFYRLALANGPDPGRTLYDAVLFVRRVDVDDADADAEAEADERRRRRRSSRRTPPLAALARAFDRAYRCARQLVVASCRRRRGRGARGKIADSPNKVI